MTEKYHITNKSIYPDFWNCIIIQLYESGNINRLRGSARQRWSCGYKGTPTSSGEKTACDSWSVSGRQRAARDNHAVFVARDSSASDWLQRRLVHGRPVGYWSGVQSVRVQSYSAWSLCDGAAEQCTATIPHLTVLSGKIVGPRPGTRSENSRKIIANDFSNVIIIKGNN